MSDCSDAGGTRLVLTVKDQASELRVPVFSLQDRNRRENGP